MTRSVPAGAGAGAIRHGRVRRRHTDQPALITSAPESPDREFERRRRRYAIMMASRTVAIVAAVLTYRTSLWLALGFCAAAIVVPWVAVVIANDRAPRRRASRPMCGGTPNDTALPAGGDTPTVDG